MARSRKKSPEEVSVRDARQHFADLLYRAAAGRTTFITSRGRRIAAVVPLEVAEDALDDEEAEMPRPRRVASTRTAAPASTSSDGSQHSDADGLVRERFEEPA